MIARRHRVTHPSLRSITMLAIIVFASTALPIAQAAAGPSAPAASPQWSSQILITNQLYTGEIDYQTSLLYRTFALFGDERLPSDLVGLGSSGDDHTLFGEIHQIWNHLPQETQNVLIPFTVRPTDSRSRYFVAGPPNNTPDLSVPVRHAQGDCSDDWASADSSRFNFKVWVHCDGDYDGDMDAAIGMIEEFWEHQEALMGTPLPDTGSEEQGGDTRIDFYFVDNESDVVERNGGDSINEQAAAHAAPTDPFVGKTSSGYMVGRRPTIRESTAKLVLAHEFHHLQQNAFNQPIAFGFKGTPYSNDFDVLSFTEFWFVEATANWSVSYSYRDLADPEDMFNGLHAFYLYAYQGSGKSLYYSPRQWSNDFIHIYGSWVYFLFLEQQHGSQVVRQFWDEISKLEADDFVGTLEVLNNIHPFEEHFRDFAVMNLNLDLQPGDPVSPSFSDVDPSFPTDYAPVMSNASNNAERLDRDPITYDVTIPSLSMDFFAFRVDDLAEAVTFDFSDLAPNDATDVDLIMRINDGEWERRQVDPSEPVTYCKNDPADDVEFVYIVLTNHDYVEATTVRGDFTVNTVASPCA